MGVIESFDLSPFNPAKHRDSFAENVGHYAHTLLTDPFCLFAFSFSHPVSACARESSVPVLAAGSAHAVVMWFELDLGDGIQVGGALSRSGIP